MEITKKEDNFANGRLARNIYDDLVLNHARRVIKMANPSDEDLVLLLSTDFTLENILIHSFCSFHFLVVLMETMIKLSLKM